MIVEGKASFARRELERAAAKLLAAGAAPQELALDNEAAAVTDIHWGYFGHIDDVRVSVVHAGEPRAPNRLSDGS